MVRDMLGLVTYTAAVFFSSCRVCYEDSMKFDKCSGLSPQAEVVCVDEFPASSDWQVLVVSRLNVGWLVGV